jgi:hypothetical protein
MKRLALVTLLFTITLTLFAPSGHARLSNNDRRAVVLEAFYALRPSHDGSCDKNINGNCASSWNYVDGDQDAYKQLRSWYTTKVCDASGWVYRKKSETPQYAYCYDQWTTDGFHYDSFYSNIHSYGYSTWYGSHGNVGRGGQCKFFANLILYRSGSHTKQFPSYSDMAGNSEKDLTKAVEGDILFNPKTSKHTAVVVEIKRDNHGKVTGLDVIDSNFVSDKGSELNREVIVRHLFQLSDPKMKNYLIWKGVKYYKQPYIP